MNRTDLTKNGEMCSLSQVHWRASSVMLKGNQRAGWALENHCMSRFFSCTLRVIDAEMLSFSLQRLLAISFSAHLWSMGSNGGTDDVCPGPGHCCWVLFLALSRLASMSVL